MTKEFDDIGADIRTLPHPTEAREASTIIRDALAATKKEQKPHKILARWFKTLKIPVRLYT